jgi:hypothetical protein
MARVRVGGVPQLEAAAAALRLVDTAVKRETTRALRATLPRVWSPGEVLDGARSPMERAALAGTRVQASATRLRLVAGSSPTIAKGTDVPQAVEFGDPNKTFTTYQRKSRVGRSHQVRRRTQEQLPAPVRRGRIVHPALARVMPRLMSLYTQTIVRTIYEAMERR